MSVPDIRLAVGKGSIASEWAPEDKAAGEDVVDGAHGFRVVKISVVSDVMFCFFWVFLALFSAARQPNHSCLKLWYCFYIRQQ
jgi:hypothetical protein